MNSRNKRSPSTANWPVHGWVGVALLSIFWALNWSLSGLHTHWCFFFMWLGFILTIDAVVYKRKQTSLFTRSKWKFTSLFLVSIPAWWLFEGLNIRTEYWIYVGREQFTDLEFALFSSVNFSTVIPAVFECSELAGTFSRISRNRAGIKIPSSLTVDISFFIGGWMMLVLVMAWPEWFVPFLWISVFFILDPVNKWLDNPSLLTDTNNGEWRRVYALFAGSLFCGFFWEVWNYWSYPKWIYNVPIVDFWHLFEMPLLGYLGYLPFALELFAIYHLVMGVKNRGELHRYLYDFLLYD